MLKKGGVVCVQKLITTVSKAPTYVAEDNSGGTTVWQAGQGRQQHGDIRLFSDIAAGKGHDNTKLSAGGHRKLSEMTAKK